MRDNFIDDETSDIGIPRWAEAAAAGAALVAIAPVMGALAVAVRLSSPGPVLFRQERVGQGGRPFTLLKFRSMRAGDGIGVTAADDRRITKVGRFLRKTKLDELPQLLNVVRGDISLVGPRPEVPQYVNLDDPNWQRVLDVRPGITDPVTLALRNEEELLAEVEDDRESFYREVLQPLKLAGYIAYLEARSIRSDLRVLWRSVLAVLVPARTPAPMVTNLEVGTFEAESERPSMFTPAAAAAPSAAQVH
jgi:lipopolysaccharide/colanic/teichoic acid biosynthesis glycosyltransferase